MYLMAEEVGVLVIICTYIMVCFLCRKVEAHPEGQWRAPTRHGKSDQKDMQNPEEIYCIAW